MFRAILTAAGLFLATQIPTTQALAETRVPQSQAEISLGFAPLVKEAAPAVVNIYAKIVQEQRRTPFMNDPFELSRGGHGDRYPRGDNRPARIRRAGGAGR
jgi:S1-C subfamily serine protease